ncbi:hypothetical protein sos41_11440 [Alphaproteobacteria bacterium SO-S41]|nr:hypothetical protein sos41_11440 [Alphaproteobacteria bacterium SO-S41]
MARPRKDVLFELAGQYIKREPGREGLWRYWFDAGTGKSRRAPLGCNELEEAKVRLAAIIIQSLNPVEHENLTPLRVVLHKYRDERTDLLPSKKPARKAIKLALGFYGEDALVTDVTPEKQVEFVKAEVARGASHTYISRNLSVIAAAFAHAGLKDMEIPYGLAWLKKVAPSDKAPRRVAIPTDPQFKILLSAPMPEPLFRWMLLELGSGGRPEAMVDFAPAQRQEGLWDLNPAGRPQNKKHRPIVREPAFLTPFLDAWDKDESTKLYGRYVAYAGVESVKTALDRLTTQTGIRISAYSFRHKVATILRRAKRSHGVTEDDISMQLGHQRPNVRITGGYGEFDPDYLDAPMRALSDWLEGLGFSRSILAIHPDRDKASGKFLKISRG